MRLQKPLHMVHLRISTVLASLNTNLEGDDWEEDDVSVSILTVSVHTYSKYELFRPYWRAKLRISLRGAAAAAAAAVSHGLDKRPLNSSVWGTLTIWNTSAYSFPDRISSTWWMPWGNLHSSQKFISALKIALFYLTEAILHLYCQKQ